jgi:hypothetical protein
MKQRRCRRRYARHNADAANHALFRLKPPGGKDITARSGSSLLTGRDAALSRWPDGV